MKRAELKDELNCPNCGAPIDGDVCKYCGTMLIDTTVMRTDKPFYLKIKMGDAMYITKVRLDTLQMDLNNLPRYEDYVYNYHQMMTAVWDARRRFTMTFVEV